MPKTKQKPSRLAPKSSPSLTALASRVKALESDFSAMRGDMNNLSEDVSALRTVVKRVDERAVRGEKLMLDMQGEQRKMARAVDRIAVALNIPPAIDPVTQTEPEPEPEMDLDEEVTTE